MTSVLFIWKNKYELFHYQNSNAIILTI